MQRFLITLLILPALALAQGQKSSHAQYFEHYEGTKTCLECHEEEAKQFFASQHYQWRGPAPNIVNAKGQALGKMNTVNDFCTNPVANWIGNVVNSRGEVISRGCSNCHAGLGKLPTEKVSREQLENIDCLICHASGYRRDLYPDDKGGVTWKSILWKNQAGLDSVSKRISQPTRVMCLRCHSASGGGANYKRGDLEYKLADCERVYDVHMGKNGKNMDCVTCHRGEAHRVRGRGTDLSGSDTIGRLGCESAQCHSKAPHGEKVLNRHAERVNCTVCHIPAFAREEPTDMFRDWSKATYNKEADKYTAVIRLEQNVKPVYAWFNGSTKEQLLKTPVEYLPDGKIGMMIPQGSRSDPKSRIYAMKLHGAKLPVLDGSNFLIPIVVEEFFKNGGIDKAVRQAAEDFYGVKNAHYTWKETTRYMGIFHGVQPASKALTCLDCHSPKGRLDWKALGYSGDPLDNAVGVAVRK